MSGRQSTYIIAEGACAHQGDWDLARRMCDIAMGARADCVKFQIFRPDLIPNISRDERKYLDKCEFSVDRFGKLREYCGKDIDFLLTPFDIPSVQNVVDLGLSTIKVPSGRLFDKPYMDAVKATGKKLIVSTGMCDDAEVRKARVDMPKGTTWLHCTSSYPCSYTDLNLSVLRSRLFDGLSDHTLSTIVPSIAVAMGAKFIEKHFTLRRTLPGPDMKVSLEPLELMDMIRLIRDVEIMMGDGIKKIEKSEQDMMYRKVTDGKENK